MDYSPGEIRFFLWQEPQDKVVEDGLLAGAIRFVCGKDLKADL